MSEKEPAKVSALQSRIDAGKADPITPLEQQLVQELRDGYEKKYGKSRLNNRRKGQ